MTDIPDALVSQMMQLIRDLHADHINYGARNYELVGRTAAIVSVLPEPIDHDLIEARRMVAAANPTVATTNFIDGRADKGFSVQCLLEGIKRGRELAGESK